MISNRWIIPTNYKISSLKLNITIGLNLVSNPFIPNLNKFGTFWFWWFELSLFGFTPVDIIEKWMHFY